VVSDQLDYELQQLILAINKASGFQKWRACAGGHEMATRVGRCTWTAWMELAARAGGIGPA